MKHVATDIYESGEDYLERILMLQIRNGSVRSIDIANDMGFSKPSVSIAMKKLREQGYIHIKENGEISLTKEGNTIAQKTYERHLFLTSLLEKIGVNPQQAVIDACKIEHDLSDETFNALKKYAGDKKL